MGDEETKAGYYYSIALHIGIVVAVAVFALVSEIFKVPPEAPVIFQMLDPVENAPIKPSDQKENPKTDVIDEPQVQDIKPFDLPKQEEEKPDPAPDPKPEEPAPKPKPVESIKPAPKPEPPKKVSYSDFIKKNPKKTSQRKVSQPKVQNVKIGKITATTDNLSKYAEAKISSNVGASSAMKDALSAYVQYINATAKRNWIMPDSIAGMNLSCSISFSVSATGSITGMRIITGSGNSDFDNSIVKLFRSLKIIAPPDGQPHNVRLIFTTEK